MTKTREQPIINNENVFIKGGTMATIKDVAQRAGLSISTVSRYLNHHPYISEDKKIKIQQAMDELDYVPNSVAMQLRSNKSYTIGIIVPRITNPYFAYLIDAIDKKIKGTPYHMLIMQTYNDKEEELRLLNMFKQRQIAGVIMGALENDIEVLETYTKYGPIILSADQSMQSDKVKIIHTTQRQMTYDAIQYLINKGYRNIAYCTDNNYYDHCFNKPRNVGFRVAMKDNGLDIRNEWIFNNVHTIEDGEQIGKILLRQEQLPDAIFTGSDEVALGLMHFMTAHQIDIPNQIAILGYDNQPISSLLKIPLSTVNQPVNDIGMQLINYLLALLEETEFEINNNVLKLNNVERQST